MTGSRADAKRLSAVVAHAPVILSALIIVTFLCQYRWTLASSTPWQCDEIPLLVRSTGLCGHVANDQEARDFEPSFYSFYMGALRSVRAPKDTTAIHTTTGFWVNLTTHLFGVTPGVGRLMPLFWSVVAIVTAAWGGWWLTRSIIASCVAACLVAASPHAIAYAAQARGYAEAMALAPLFLIALEAVRRRPNRWLRVILLWICAVQLSLTVYTMWLYWVAPMLLISLFVLPRMERNVGKRKSLRLVLVLTTVSVFVFMGFYTIDRLESLMFTASVGGAGMASTQAIWQFVRNTASHLTVVPLVALAFAAIGTVVVYRAKSTDSIRPRWWLSMFALGLTGPIIVAVVNGSAGFSRNFGYLVVPLALLAGTGVDRVVGALRPRGRLMLSSIVLSVAMFCSAAWVRGDASSRVRAIIEPDWGSAVIAIDSEPETIGPRWFCHSMANHWQINWYRAPEHLIRCLDTTNNNGMELVLGTQSDENHQEVVYQRDFNRNAILPKHLPSWLGSIPPNQEAFGVSLRRWHGVRTPTNSNEADFSPDQLLFVVLAVPDARATAAQQVFRQWHRDQDEVRFKPVRVGNQTAYSWITTSRHFLRRRSLLHQFADKNHSTIHLFRLAPIHQ